MLYRQFSTELRTPLKPLNMIAVEVSNLKPQTWFQGGHKLCPMIPRDTSLSISQAAISLIADNLPVCVDQSSDNLFYISK